VLGHGVTTAEVIHQSGAPSTALRISDGARVFAYSGDTEWTDALVGIADGADLFICECYGYAGVLRGHLSWEVLKPKLPALRAKRIMLTHMNASMLAKIEEARAAGVEIAEDGMAVEI
jgi:ribonuclease BN (tRNA processing enzyme)